MSDKRSENPAFSKDVDEKISMVFQNFAVNPVVDNISKSLAELDTKIFGEEEFDLSLQEQISDNNDSINRVKREVSSGTDKICSEIDNLVSLLGMIKANIAEYKQESNEKYDTKGNEICKKINLLVQEINTNSKKLFDDASNQNKNIVDELVNKINTCEQNLESLVTQHNNDIKTQINQNYDQTKSDSQEILKALDNTYLQLENAISDFVKTVLNTFEQNNKLYQNTADSVKTELLENITNKYNKMQKLIFGVLAANGILLGAVIAAILLIVK